jgi:hypothetical protein
MSVSPEPNAQNPAEDAGGAPPGTAMPASPERMNIAREFWLFLLENKAWWLAPIIIVALLLILLVVVGGTPAGAFIYTLF